MEVNACVNHIRMYVEEARSRLEPEQPHTRVPTHAVNHCQLPSVAKGTNSTRTVSRMWSTHANDTSVFPHIFHLICRKISTPTLNPKMQYMRCIRVKDTNVCPMRKRMKKIKQVGYFMIGILFVFAFFKHFRIFFDKLIEWVEILGASSKLKFR